jgi:hypothetical protein
MNDVVLFVTTFVEFTVNETAGHCPDSPEIEPLS